VTVPARRAERARLARERKHARRLRRELESGRADQDPALLPSLHRRGAEMTVPPELRRGTVVGAGWPGDSSKACSPTSPATSTLPHAARL
jgi:hypothetical protein